MQNQNPKNQIAELDLVKFQLLTSYLGMAKIKLEGVAEKREHYKAELELLEYKEREVTAEVEHVQSQVEKHFEDLKQQYNVRPEDGINFATGEITRGAHDATGTKPKAQEEVQTQKTPTPKAPTSTIASRSARPQ